MRTEIGKFFKLEVSYIKLKKKAKILEQKIVFKKNIDFAYIPNFRHSNLDLYCLIYL